MLEPGSSCHFFSSIFLFGQSDFQVSKTIFDSREILFLELLLLFWSSCYFLELLLGSSIWWRELGETPSDLSNHQHHNVIGAFVRTHNCLTQELRYLVFAIRKRLQKFDSVQRVLSFVPSYTKVVKS